MQKTFEPLTPDQIAAFRTKAAAAGVNVPPGNTGKIVTNGITMAFEYDGTSKLTLTILDSPWYVTSGMIWDKLQPYLD